MRLLLVSTDLTVLARVEGPAHRCAASLTTAADMDQAMARAATEQPDVVILDLTNPKINVGTLVKSLRSSASNRPRIIAFGPHVHEERLEAARQAGCDEVLSRGGFFGQIDAIVTRGVS